MLDRYATANAELSEISRTEKERSPVRHLLVIILSSVLDGEAKQLFTGYKGNNWFGLWTESFSWSLANHMLMFYPCILLSLTLQDCVKGQVPLLLEALQLHQEVGRLEWPEVWYWLWCRLASSALWSWSRNIE